MTTTTDPFSNPQSLAEAYTSRRAKSESAAQTEPRGYAEELFDKILCSDEDLTREELLIVEDDANRLSNLLDAAAEKARKTDPFYRYDARIFEYLIAGRALTLDKIKTARGMIDLIDDRVNGALVDEFPASGEFYNGLPD